MNKPDPKSKLCPCGNVAVGKTANTWTCQRCKDWDEAIYGNANGRGVAGIRRFLRRGESPIIEEAEVFA